jgi:amidohydrolase
VFRRSCLSWMNRAAALGAVMFAASTANAEISPQQLAGAVSAIDDEVIAWRRDIHQHPELGNREFRTSKRVAAHLKKLGLPIKTGIAHTGVTAVLKGGLPGPTIALRADMDALPVTEQVDVPFKSTATAEYLGEKVGVMHACGHDVHVAVLMGVAQALVGLREQLPGTVLFIFQPAEEGPPPGEEGGAALMLKQGLFSETKPEAVFGLHVSPQPSGVIGYRSGPFLAGSDTFRIQVTGRQTHGALPWLGVDPIVAAAQIVTGLQTIVSRQVDITRLPAVVTVGKIAGGVRSNIVPDSVEMSGTIRTFDPNVRVDIIDRVRRTAESIAAASGAKAELVVDERSNPVVLNDPKLTARVLPSLRRVAGEQNVVEMALLPGAEDFAYYAQQVPSFYFFVGATPPGMDVAANRPHSPVFHVHEPAIAVATRAMITVALDYLQGARSDVHPSM